jgi:flagellum-specific ATP synthase
MRLDWPTIDDALRRARPVSVVGRVSRVAGLLVEATLPGASLGTTCELARAEGEPVHGEVVGLRGDTVSIVPLSAIHGLRSGAAVRPLGLRTDVPLSEGLLGRVLDGLGRPLDGRPLPPATDAAPLRPQPANPLTRASVTRPLDLGVRAVGGLLTCGEGQRVAILAGAGVGKSTLLGMMARGTAADVSVLALVGERSREVLKFIESDLGPGGLERSIVVASTGDDSPALRLRAAALATTVAEFFRDRGRRVLLMMDSLTRVAMAQREIGLALGEPPATKGYPPSAFTLIPQLLERAGATRNGGSITGLYTVLVEGDDDIQDPVSDAVRATADGHFVLSRRLAQRGHFPAIDVLKSASRVMSDVVDDAWVAAATHVRRLLADHAEVEELVQLGAYRKGSVPRFDQALAAHDAVRQYLAQDARQPVSLAEAGAALRALVAATGGGGSR